MTVTMGDPATIARVRAQSIEDEELLQGDISPPAEKAPEPPPPAQPEPEKKGD